MLCSGRCSGCGQENAVGARFCIECGVRLEVAASEPIAPLQESNSAGDLAVSRTKPGQSSLSGNSPLGAFVGRQQELAGLMAVLEESLAGRGRLVMLAGEPGIGKTRTAQELASHAESLRAQVLWGRCYEEDGAPPYWPWLQLLSSYIQQQAPEQL